MGIFAAVLIGNKKKIFLASLLILALLTATSALALGPGPAQAAASSEQCLDLRAEIIKAKKQVAKERQKLRILVNKGRQMQKAITNTQRQLSKLEKRRQLIKERLEQLPPENGDQAEELRKRLQRLSVIIAVTEERLQRLLAVAEKNQSAIGAQRELVAQLQQEINQLVEKYRQLCPPPGRPLPEKG